jgi:hypothetical protein
MYKAGNSSKEWMPVSFLPGPDDYGKKAVCCKFVLVMLEK